MPEPKDLDPDDQTARTLPKPDHYHSPLNDTARFPDNYTDKQQISMRLITETNFFHVDFDFLVFMRLTACALRREKVSLVGNCADDIV